MKSKPNQKYKVILVCNSEETIFCFFNNEEDAENYIKKQLIKVQNLNSFQRKSFKIEKTDAFKAYLNMRAKKAKEQTISMNCLV